jgi:NAD(P)H-dependent flavin oxidoreductase YrpB (nitropropane dioxygenase family)
MDLRQLADAIARRDAAPTGQFGVNLRSDAPDVMERAELMVKEGVRVASFALAPSEKLMKALQGPGPRLHPLDRREAPRREGRGWGADAVIVQGGEAGGHTGSVPDHGAPAAGGRRGRHPVIAAGGFFDGRGSVAALAYGAVGIAMGTRFLLTSDSPVPAAIKQIYLAKAVTDTIVTTQVDGHPHRVLRTPFVDRLVETNALTSLPRAIVNAFRFQRMLGTPWRELFREALSMKRSQELSWSQVVMAANAPMLLRASMVEGNAASGVMAGGQVTGLIEDLPSCAELIDRIVREADGILQRLRAEAGRAPSMVDAVVAAASPCARGDRDDRRRPPDLHVLLLRRRAASEFVPAWTCSRAAASTRSDGAAPAVTALDDAAASARLGLASGGLALLGRRGARDAERRAARSRRTLSYVARWITPPGPPRRYDTRFFVAALPPGQTPVADSERGGARRVGAARAGARRLRRGLARDAAADRGHAADPRELCEAREVAARGAARRVGADRRVRLASGRRKVERALPDESR